MFGLTRGTTAAHVGRAAVESIAYQVADLLAAMQADAGRPLKELRVDGGATRNDALLQFQSDLLRVPVVRPRTTETTALGAAFLAGLAVGFWKDQAEIASLWSADQTFRAKARPADVARLRRGWDEAVRCTRSWSHPIETPARRRR